MSRPLPILVVALAVASLAGALPARADDVAEAKARFRKAVELYRDRRWREAMVEFEAAYRLKPHGAIHFNVAQCRERLEDWPGALRSYHDYLRELPDATDRVAVRASMRRLEERLAAAGVQALLVYTEPLGAQLTLDGKERGTTPLHAVIAPGTHTLVLTLEGYEPLKEQVALSAKAARVVEVTLHPLPLAPAPAAAAPDLAPRPPAESLPRPPAPRPAPARRRAVAWIAAGTAVVAAAAGAYLGWSARQDEEEIDAMSAPDGAVASRRARDAESKARAANVLYAIAGGAGAAGAALFVLEARF